MSKTIVVKKDNFTTIHNKLITDNSISLKAKGIMLYMLSKPVGWKYNPKDIANNSKDGLESVYSGLKELIEAKYISRRKNKNGTVDYFVFEDNSENNIKDYSNSNQEKPNQEKPNQEKPNQDFADVLIIKDSTNKELNNKELNNKEKNKKEKSKNGINEFINNLYSEDEYKELLFKYVEYRKDIKKPLKTIAPIQKIIKDFPDYFSLDEAINIAIAKEWQGLEPEWIAKYKQSKANNFNSKQVVHDRKDNLIVDDNYLEQMKERYGL